MLPLLSIGCAGDFSASLRSASASFLSFADIFLSAVTSAICALMTASAPTYFLLVVAGKAVLLGDAFELCRDLGIRLGILRQLRGDRIEFRTRRQHALNLLFG